MYTLEAEFALHISKPRVGVSKPELEKLKGDGMRAGQHIGQRRLSGVISVAGCVVL
jgi:hypothetical protein